MLQPHTQTYDSIAKSSHLYGASPSMSDQQATTSTSKRSRVRPSSSSTGSSQSLDVKPIAKPPRKHARVEPQQNDLQRKAPDEADHERDPEEPNAEDNSNANAIAEDADMNGSNDDRETDIDDTNPPVHRSPWKY